VNVLDAFSLRAPNKTISENISNYNRTKISKTLKNFQFRILLQEAPTKYDKQK